MPKYMSNRTRVWLATYARALADDGFVLLPTSSFDETSFGIADARIRAATAIVSACRPDVLPSVARALVNDAPKGYRGTEEARAKVLQAISDDEAA